MHRLALHTLGLSLTLATAAPLAAQSPPPALVFTHATILDGSSAEPLRDAMVVIRDGKITRITTGPDQPPAGAVVIDLQGRWLLPGLIDAHVHLRTLAAARAMLASGVTTARSLGVDHFADVGVRELHARGAADLPDVIAAGYHVRPAPAEALFVDLPGTAELMGGVSGPDAVRTMVRALVARGANVIKIMATERAGLPTTDPRKRVYSEEELAAAVQEAGRSGVPVAAHAHGDEGAAAAVRAGVRTIEHGTYLGEGTLALMKSRGVCLVPTIATVIDMIEPGGEYDDPVLSMRGRAMLPRLREATGNAARLGVPLVAGTDTEYQGASTRRIADELAEMIRSGVTPLVAFRSATSVAAQCLGIADRTGAVRAGLEADLIVVDRNPLEDLDALRDVVLVVNDGRVAVDRRYR